MKSLVTLQDENVNILATAIHNGHEMHPGLLADCGISESDRLREEDPYTEAFISPYPNRISLYTSRFTVDLNRSPEKAVYLQPQDCWGLPVRLKQPSSELLTELHNSYDQWYNLLDNIVKRLLEKHSLLLVLDIHSYNHRRNGADAMPDPQLQNPDIILGRSNMPLQYYPFVDKLQAELNGCEIYQQSLDCRIDVKFTGGWMSRWLHHQFPGRICSLSVEFKKIFMDEWTGKCDELHQQALTSGFYQAIHKNLHILTGVNTNAQI